MATAYGISSPQTQEAFAELRKVEDRETAARRQLAYEGSVVAKVECAEVEVPQEELQSNKDCCRPAESKDRMEMRGMPPPKEEGHDCAVQNSEGIAWRRPPHNVAMAGMHAAVQAHYGQPSKRRPSAATPKAATPPETRPKTAEGEADTTVWPGTERPEWDKA